MNCPVTLCGKKSGPGMFMCRQHWFGTPRALRDEVWRTWRIINSAQHRHADAGQRQRNIAGYRAACRAATGYWNEGKAYG